MKCAPERSRSYRISKLVDAPRRSPSRLYGYASLLDGDGGTPAYAGSLYPCYLLLFDEASLAPGGDVPADLGAARAAAAFEARLEDDGSRERTVDVDPARFASGAPRGSIVYARLQLASDAPEAALALAELEVYARRPRTVGGYAGGGSVAARPWTAPFAAAESLSSNFASAPVGGPWTLTVRDGGRPRGIQPLVFLGTPSNSFFEILAPLVASNSFPTVFWDRPVLGSS